jgi:hypothetical protein
MDFFDNAKNNIIKLIKGKETFLQCKARFDILMFNGNGFGLRRAEVVLILARYWLG